ncbi:PAS domain-containing sensor histidine kinase [Desulfuromonas versatilis]|nr:PAS domain-containing sensor histidine kinase [Desulfuromonas versatilis]
MPQRIRKPLIVLTLLSMLILVAAGITYRSTTVLVDQTLADHQQAIADEAAEMTEIWLSQQTRILNATVASASVLPLTGNPDTLRLLKLAMRAGHFSDVYIGTISGELIDGADWIPSADYDPRRRPWYQRAVEVGETSFTSPYVDLVTNELVIALVSPITLDGVFRGVMGADTVLDTLVANLSTVKVGDTGYAFIVNEKGTILIHPNPDYVLKVRLQDTETGLARILESFERSPAGTFSYPQGEATNILAYRRIAGSNWYLCTTIPSAEAYAISRKTTMLFVAEMVLKSLAVLALATLLLVVGGVLVLLVFRRQYSSTLQKQREEITGINQDLAWNISKRKEFETHYQTLFNVANDGILVSKDLTCIECNEKATEVFGLSRLGLIGRSMLDISPALQPDGEDSRERLQRILDAANAGKHQVFEWTFHRADGSEFPAEVGLKTLQLDKERLCLSSIRDISKRVYAEQQLRQAQKMAAMGEMLGAIAHQWRQPLNTLSTYIASLQSAHYNNMISKNFVDTLVAGADAQIQFMSKTIDDFRHFFRPSKNKEAFDVARAVANAVKLLEPNLKQDAVQLAMRIEEPGPPFVVQGFPSEFIHVVVNILANARDSIVERRTRDSLAGPGMIEVDINGGGEAVLVQVRDNGVGIPQHLLEKIFTPYFTTKGTTAGTGIGLYMAKIIVEKEMKGELLADNLEQGARMTIRIPKAAA